jgi:hypothetical protein
MRDPHDDEGMKWVQGETAERPAIVKTEGKRVGSEKEEEEDD